MSHRQRYFRQGTFVEINQTLEFLDIGQPPIALVAIVVKPTIFGVIWQVFQIIS
jgi:hypothetical protein